MEASKIKQDKVKWKQTSRTKQNTSKQARQRKRKMEENKQDKGKWKKQARQCKMEEINKKNRMKANQQDKRKQTSKTKKNGSKNKQTSVFWLVQQSSWRVVFNAQTSPFKLESLFKCRMVAHRMPSER